MKRFRILQRAGLVTCATGTAVALLAGAAHANVSTFVGNAVTDCTWPALPPGGGTSTGFGACHTTATSATCVTSVDTPEGAVVASCTGSLEAGTSPFFVLYRESAQGPVFAACAGAGSGTFLYRASPSSPAISIPVAVSVHGTTAEFSGVAVVGLNTATVSGTYSAACRGYGAFAGQVA